MNVVKEVFVEMAAALTLKAVIDVNVMKGLCCLQMVLTVQVSDFLSAHWSEQ